MEPVREILTPTEVSEWLRIPKTTLYKLCGEAQIPCVKIGKHWRFDKKKTHDWFQEQTLAKLREPSDGKNFEPDLIASQEHSKTGNQAQRDFLANLSHELRTPLGHIIGFTEIIVDKDCGDLNETQEEYLQDTLRSARHLRDDIAIADPESYQESHHDLQFLSEKALTDRPLMKLLDNSLQQLGFSKRLAKSAWYPKVSLLGRYEQNGEDWTASENDYANFYNTSVGVVAEWKFWRSGKTSADIRRVNREMAALTARIDLLKGQVLEEVYHAVLDCEVALSNIGTASRSLTQAEENWRITQKQYKHQIATSTDVLDARTFLSGADTNYNTAVYGYLVAVAALERAVGERGVY